MPPSDTTGMPYFVAHLGALENRLTCGMPIPATMRVVQMEPAPMPTLTQSAPALMSASVASAVATLPATS